MTWEQPTALWLLLAILLLLFKRSTTPQTRLAVATLFLWSDLESQNATVFSRRHWLLFLQAAFVAIVVIALARPLITFGGHHIGIVLDVSMSMGARDGVGSRLDAAKARAVSLVQDLPRGGRATLWLAGSEVALLGEFARPEAALEQALEPVRPTDAAANLDVAIEHARQAAPRVSRIYVITDAPTPAPTAAPDLGWVPVGGRADNASITTLEARRNAHNGTVDVLVAVRNHASTAMTGEVLITREDSVLARRTLSLIAGQESSVVFELPDLEGVVAARLEYQDALAADNTRSTIVAPASPLHTLLVGTNHWIEQALAAHPDVITFAVASPDGDGPDLVICASCAEVPEANPRAGVLLLPPPASSPREPAAVVVTNGTHPVMRGLNADGVLVSPAGSGQPLADQAVLARAATMPVIVAGESGQRRIVELRFDPSASGIAGEVTFPLLVANAVEWLAAPQRRSRVIVAGESLRHTLRGDGDRPPVVTGPGGRDIPARLSGSDLIVADTAIAGIYRVTAEGRDAAFVVNPAVVKESDLLGTVPSAQTASPVEDDTRASRQEITPALLLIALGLLAFEWRQRVGERGR